MSNGSFLTPLGVGAGNDVSLESIVRPFAQDLRPRWPTPVTQGPNETAPEPEAYLEWGGPGDFESDERDTPVEDINADGYVNDYASGGVQLQDPGETHKRKDPTPQDSAKGVHEYDEVDRSVQRTKIWNPEDNEDWMVIERVTTIRFRNKKTGIIAKFNLKPPPMPPKPDTSDNP